MHRTTEAAYWAATRTRRLRWACVLSSVVALAWAGVLTLGAGHATASAFAHSDPMPGEVLSSSPPRLDIFSDADLTTSALNAIDVRAADLREVDLRDATLDPQNPRHLSVGLQPALGAGRYVVTFVAAQTGAAVDRGQFSFYIGVAPSSADRVADARLSVGGGVTQPSSTVKDPTAPLAIGVAVGIAGVISAGTIIVLRRRRLDLRDW